MRNNIINYNIINILKKYRYLDFFRRINKRGILLKIFYDTNRTGKIGLILYENGLSAYILIQKGLVMHNLIYSGDQSLGHNIKKGYSVLLNNMPLFSIVSNIENKPFKGGNICRAACVSALLISKDKSNGILKLNSG